MVKVFVGVQLQIFLFKSLHDLNTWIWANYPFLLEDLVRLYQIGWDLTVNCHAQVFMGFNSGLLLPHSSTVRDLS